MSSDRSFRSSQDVRVSSPTLSLEVGHRTWSDLAAKNGYEDHALGLGAYSLESRGLEDASHSSLTKDDESFFEDSIGDTGEYVSQALRGTPLSQSANLADSVSGQLHVAASAAESASSEPKSSRRSMALASWTQARSSSMSSFELQHAEEIASEDVLGDSQCSLRPPFEVPGGQVLPHALDLDDTPLPSFPFLSCFPLGTDPLLLAHAAENTLQSDIGTECDSGPPFADPFAGHYQVPHAALPAQRAHSGYSDLAGWAYGASLPTPQYTDAMHEWQSSGYGHAHQRVSYPPSVQEKAISPNFQQREDGSCSEPQQPPVVAHPQYLTSTVPGRHGKRSILPAPKEPLYWQSQTTAATKQAAIARRTPGAEARFACHWCGEISAKGREISPKLKPTTEHSFTRAYNLRGHLRAHQGERPYVCEVPGCGKAFARSHDRRRHQDLHSSACKFRCETCLRPFRRLDALNKHIQTESQLSCSMAESGHCLSHSTGHCAYSAMTLQVDGDTK